MDTKHNWEDYYKVTAKNKPSKLLVNAINYVRNKEFALELGAGTPKDSIFLLDQGFSVIAVDKEVNAESQFSELINNPKFEFKLASFEDFDYPLGYFNLISAQRALPFLQTKDLLIKVVNSIKGSLKIDGIFTGHFFGPRDTWCSENKQMTFVNKEEVESLISGLEVIKIMETEEDSQTASGTPHYWHILSVIAKKSM